MCSGDHFRPFVGFTSQKRREVVCRPAANFHPELRKSVRSLRSLQDHGNLLIKLVDDAYEGSGWRSNAVPCTANHVRISLLNDRRHVREQFGAVCEWPDQRPRGTAACVLHPDYSADGRRCKYLAVLHTPDYGLIDQGLRLFGFGAINWLGNTSTALPALMAVTVWKEAGFFMIFFLAALQQVSPDLYEAARMENASRWQVFSRITWPLVMPTTLFVAVNALINAFRIVDQVIAMTGGGPDNATTLLLFYIYQVGFSFWDTGYAAALSSVLLIILGTVSLAQFFLLDRRIHYR